MDEHILIHTYSTWVGEPCGWHLGTHAQAVGWLGQVVQLRTILRFYLAGSYSSERAKYELKSSLGHVRTLVRSFIYSVK